MANVHIETDKEGMSGQECQELGRQKGQGRRGSDASCVKLVGVRQSLMMKFYCYKADDRLAILI
jgi:hypothetical protein